MSPGGDLLLFACTETAEGTEVRIATDSEIDAAAEVEAVKLMKLIDIAFDDFLIGKSESSRKLYRVTWQQWVEWCEQHDKKPGWARLNPMRGKTVFCADYDTAKRFFGDLQKRPGHKARDGRSDRLAPATVELKMSMLKTIYEWLIENDYFKLKNPFKFPRKKLSKDPTKRPLKELSAAQVDLLLSVYKDNGYTSTMNNAIIGLMFGLAMRGASEIPPLRICDVDLEAGTIIIAEQKNGNRSEIPLEGIALEGLQKFMPFREGADPHDYLFIRREGPYSKVRIQMSESYIKTVWDRACKAAGLPKGYTPHCARAAAITRLYDRGFTTRQIQPLARHANGATTERYDKRKRNDLRLVVKGLTYKKAS